MDRELDRVLISRDRLASRVAQMGLEITAQIRGQVAPGPVVLVPVLTGAMVFVADLIRNIPLKMSVRPVTISSYPGKATESMGVTVRGEVPTGLGGCHVVLVDDILDSGRTLGLLKRCIAAQGPASLRTAVLLAKRKPRGREEEVAVEHVGFEIDDEFVVGYGLDYDGYFRNLPEIRVLSDAGIAAGREAVAARSV